MIPAEFNPKYCHKRGALAMARPDANNPNKMSSPTEFYIVQGMKYDSTELFQEAKELNIALLENQIQYYTTVGGTLSLDGKYTVFGEVEEGLDIVQKMAQVQTFGADKPVNKIPFKIQLLK
jgi:peptidyl-prolyl cis-trans isomerase B (cyclophilin B)